MAINPEGLIYNSPETIKDVSSLNIPVTWHQSITEEIAQDRSVDTNPDFIPAAEASAIALHLFEDRHLFGRNNSLVATVRHLSGVNVKIAEIDHVHNHEFRS